MSNTGYAKEFENALRTFSTPFNSNKIAKENVQLSVEPQFGLTKRRYSWYSNGNLFDETLFDDTVESGIRLQTTATSGDEARIKSSIAGLYIAQALAQVGVACIIDDNNVELDENNHSSLTHGEVYVGAFWWDDTNSEPYTGVGYKWDTDGWTFFVKSLGYHIGKSPIHQSEFGFDTFDGSGPSGNVIDPSDGYVWNWKYTWYNEGAFEGAVLNVIDNHIQTAVRDPIQGSPSTDVPNLPPQLVVRNAGTAEQLGVELGGMQYSTFGAGIDDVEFRRTEETRVTEGQSYISDPKNTTNDAIDPNAQPGVPLISVRRQSGYDSLAVRVKELNARPLNDDIYVFEWDEYNPSTALTGATFGSPQSVNLSGESRLVTDTSATDYTPSSDALLRSLHFMKGGQKNQESQEVTDISDIRVPSGATRVITAVYDGDTVADVDPIKVKLEESY